MKFTDPIISQISRADSSRSWGRITSGTCDSVSVCVRALEEKRLKLSTNLLDIQRTTVDSEKKRSKVKVTQLSNVPPTWVCRSI